MMKNKQTLFEFCKSLFEEIKRKSEIEKICKANNYNCSECIHGDVKFEGVRFRGFVCKLQPDGSRLQRKK